MRFIQIYSGGNHEDNNWDAHGDLSKNLHATILHLLGFEPNHLSCFHGGLEQRLVGVEGAEPIWSVLA